MICANTPEHNSEDCVLLPIFMIDLMQTREGREVGRLMRCGKTLFDLSRQGC